MKGNNFIGYVIVLAFLSGIAYNATYLINPYRIDSDARQHIFWTYKFKDPELFNDDLLVKFISSPKFCPFGWKVLYYVVAKFIDPILFSKILPIILNVFCAFFIFKLGSQLGGEQVGFLSSLFFCLSLPKFLVGGYPRSFALPVFILFLFALCRKRFWLLGFSLLMQALFYPPIILNSLILLPFIFFRNHTLDTEIIKESLLPLFIFCISAFIIIAYSYLFYQPEFIGPIVNYEEAKKMPEFWDGGRNAFFSRSPFIFWLGKVGYEIRSGIGAFPTREFFYFFILGLIYILLIRKKIIFLPIIIWLIISSLILFLLSHIFLFHLYLPSRYTKYTIPLALILLLSFNLPRIFPNLLKRLAIVILILISLIIPSSVACSKFYESIERQGFHLNLYLRWVRRRKRFAKRTWFYKVPKIICVKFPIVDRRYTDEKRNELYCFLSSLPKDALIVAHPYLADDIPLFTKRSVLVSEELSSSWYKNYYQQMKERLYDTFKLIYAVDLGEVNPIFHKYGITHLVLSKKDFDLSYLNQIGFYHKPFDDFVKKRVIIEKGFIFNNRNSPWVTFSNDDYWVIEVASLSRGELKKSR